MSDSSHRVTCPYCKLSFTRKDNMARHVKVACRKRAVIKFPKKVEWVSCKIPKTVLMELTSENKVLKKEGGSNPPTHVDKRINKVVEVKE